MPLADPVFDASLAPDSELSAECPSYVEVAKRALALAGEGFADVRHAATEKKHGVPEERCEIRH